MNAVLEQREAEELMDLRERYLGVRIVFGFEKRFAVQLWTNGQWFEHNTLKEIEERIQWVKAL